MPSTRALVLSLLLLLPVAAEAQAPKVDRIDVIEAGIYQVVVKSNLADPKVPSGTRQNLNGAKLVKATNTIPAVLGTRFGFRFKIVGEPTGGPVALKWVIRFPPPGIRNERNQLQRSYEENIATAIGTEEYRDALFDSPSDLVPGVWTMEVWSGNQKMAQQQFTVVRR